MYFLLIFLTDLNKDPLLIIVLNKEIWNYNLVKEMFSDKKIPLCKVNNLNCKANKLLIKTLNIKKELTNK